jgi:predicted TIM-barrel fold metal-dependent hydrolase
VAAIPRTFAIDEGNLSHADKARRAGEPSAYWPNGPPAGEEFHAFNQTVNARMSTHIGSPFRRHIQVRPEWLAKRWEDIIEPELPIIDPHHHLWDHPGDSYLLPEMLADFASGHNIVATVYTEAKSMYRQGGDPAMQPVGETEFVNGVAAMSASGNYGPMRACAKIIGFADLRLGSAVKRVLEAHVAAAGGRFAGVRHHSLYHADLAYQGVALNAEEGLLGNARFREGFRCLAPLGLSYDAWLYHEQIPELEDLAKASPETTIVINHIGNPGGTGPYESRRDEVFAEWSKNMRAIARCPNVNIKIGGFGMRRYGYKFHEGLVPASSEEMAKAWQRYIDATIEIFGPQRCMFESNFPVDKGMFGYPILWNAFKRASAKYSPGERAALFLETAARVYKVPLS